MTRIMHNFMMQLLFLTTFSHAIVIYKGSSPETPPTFSVAIGSFAFAPKTEDRVGLIFTGAATAQADNTFALAYSTFTGNTFRALAPKIITLNTVLDQVNPLNGAQINLIGQLGQFPIAIPAAEPNTIYFLNSSTMEEISTVVQDTQENPSTEILAITTNSPLAHANGYSSIITVVTPNIGAFGSVGSGLTYIPVQKTVVEVPPIEKNKKPTNKDVYNFGSQSSIPLQFDTPALFINSPAVAFNNAASLVYDGTLSGLYVGLQVTGNVGVNDGVRAVAYIKNDVHAIAPDSAITADSIIGAKGSNTQVSIHDLKIMYTSTGLFYLIVWGGVGSPAATAQNVYALPLVTLGNFAGMLANVNSSPFEIYSDNPPYILQYRGFTQPALVPGDLYTPANSQAVVGNNTPLPSDITSMFVQGDTIFVSCESDGANQKAGVFASQAIFNDTAKIIGWTNWKRVAGTSQPSTGVIFDSATGEVIFMTGSSIATINTVNRTEWTHANSIAQAVATAFKTSTSKVQGLWDFPSLTNGFNQTLGDQIAVTIATGFEQALFMQTGSDAVTNLFGPDAPQEIFNASHGSLAGFMGGKAINFTELSELGAITSAGFAYDGNNGWFVVGGTGGIGILAREDGSGATLVGNNFSGLTADMTLKQFPIASGVRKISVVENNIFVLTPYELLRIPLNATRIANNNLVVYKIATTETFPLRPDVIFSDVIISNALALLATSQGLFRSGNNVDVQTITSSKEISLFKIDLNESVGPITRLLSITTDSLESSLSNGGMVFALNGYVGYDQTRIYRISIEPFANVSDTTVANFPDYFIKGRKTFYLNYGSYRNYFFTDGAMLYASRSAYKPVRTPPFLQVLAMIHPFDRFVARNSLIVLHPSPFIAMGRLINLSGAGILAVHGDFGLYVQG